MPRTIAIQLKMPPPHNIVLGTVQIPVTDADAGEIAKRNGGIPYYGPTFRNGRQAEACNTFFDNNPEFDYQKVMTELVKEALSPDGKDRKRYFQRKGVRKPPNLNMFPETEAMLKEQGKDNG